MKLNKIAQSIIFAAMGVPFLASAASVTYNDDTNSFSGLDAWMMISKDLGNTWEAYTDESQNNFPGSTYGIIAAKDELAIISQPYDPNSTYKGGDKVRFLGYYWTAQWWVDQGVSPSTDSVWKKGDKVNFNIYSEYQFTPYTGQKAEDLQNNEKKKVKSQRKVIGYFPEWGVYEAHNYFTPDKVNYKGLSHLNYGFAVVKNGVITMHDTTQAPKLMRDLASRTEKNNVTFMLSVGGWDNSQEGVFEAATRTDEGVEKLANSMVDYVHTWNFDGLDIDWEYPDNDSEKAQFTKLIKSLRAKLDEQGRKDDKYYQLSAAVTTNHKNVAYINPAVTADYLDSINVMAYDIHGAFDAKTGHNAPLFANQKDDDQKLNVASAMSEYADVWQIPKEKLMMGVPYYGRGWGSVPATQVEPGLPGLFAPGEASVKGAWDDEGQYTGTNPWYVLKEKLASGEYKRYWDPQSHVPYLYSVGSQEFLTYDDPQSIREKVDYINQQGFGGAIIWDISGDTAEYELGNIVDDILTTSVAKEKGAYLYTDINYQGDNIQTNDDISCLVDVTSTAGKKMNDVVSSVKISEGTLGANVFTNCNYGGTKITLLESNPALSSGNNAISSVKIIKAIAYENYGLEGRSLVMDGDIEDLSTYNLNDALSSIQVAQGYKARLYENGHYKGNYIDITAGSAALRDGFNDKVSSVQFIKE